MRIDNSRAKAFFRCPAEYQERYEFNIEPQNRDNFAFGSRWAELQEEKYRRLLGENFTAPPCDNEAIENEAQTMLARYNAHYPTEPFDVVAVEKFFELPLPRTHCWECGSTDLTEKLGLIRSVLCKDCHRVNVIHTYVGEMDAIVRDKETGLLQLFETKSERRGSKANTPEAWAAKSQVGLYLWTAEQIYNEPFKNVILNVCTRQSPAGREQASFRRDMLQRSLEEKQAAIENIIYIADQIEAMEQNYGTERLFPQNRNACVNEMTGWRCDYYDLHVIARGGRDENLVQIKFQPAEEYLAGL